jgi:hypothetical protein
MIGNIILFVLVLSILLVISNADFSGDYDPIHWTQYKEGDSSIDTSGAPSKIVMTGPNAGSSRLQHSIPSHG